MIVILFFDILYLYKEGDKKMILNIVLLIVGFVVLIKGADLFVDGASSIAGNFKISKDEYWIFHVT